MRVRDEVDGAGRTVRAAAPRPRRRPPAIPGASSVKDDGNTGRGRSVRVAEEAPGPLAGADESGGDVAELVSGIRMRAVIRSTNDPASEPERRPVEIVVRDEARMLVAARARECDREHRRMDRAGQTLQAAERRRASRRSPRARTGEHVARPQRVVHIGELCRYPADTHQSATMRLMASEIRDVTPGLWIWSVEYPDWRPSVGWGPSVWSTCVESRRRGRRARTRWSRKSDEVWARLDAKPPTVAVVLKPDHVRDVDLMVERYGARAFGPWLFWRQNMPHTELEAVQPGTELPGGLVALHDGRGRMETPLWLPEQRAVVFADALTAPEGDLLVGRDALARGTSPPGPACPARPALRDGHRLAPGKPVHDRAAFEQALERPPHSFYSSTRPARSTS